MATRVLAPSLRFESLAFQVEPGKGFTNEASARAVIRRALPGRSWTITAPNLRTGEFEATLRKGRRLTPAGAWDAAYRLRRQAEVVYAEPLFELPNEEQFAPPPRKGRQARSAGGGDDDPGTEASYEWSLDAQKVPPAWKMFGSRLPGGGVVVGHPEEAEDYQNPRYMQLLMEHHYEDHILRLPADEWPEPVTCSFARMNHDIYLAMQGPSELGVRGKVANWDRTAELRDIRVPTLVIGARYDTMDPQHMEWMAGRSSKRPLPVLPQWQPSGPV